MSDNNENIYHIFSHSYIICWNFCYINIETGGSKVKSRQVNRYTEKERCVSEKKPLLVGLWVIYAAKELVRQSMEIRKWGRAQ
jgi:hypothetical protein